MDVTLGHFSASARADALVTRRQLLPPKPSVKPSLIFFGPHQDGLPAACLADDVAARVRTAAAASASASSEPLFVLILLCLLSTSVMTVSTGRGRVRWERRSARGGRRRGGRGRAS